jgi:DNA segregation ATPase FtsK/SpoIIIE-like protein
LLDAHGIKVKPVRITVQKEKNLFLFDFAVGTKIDDILNLDKEIAAILASPTGKVDMGVPFKGTPFLFIYLAIAKKMKEETYQVFDIDVKNAKRDPLFKYRVKVREVLLGIADFLDKMAYKI